MRVSAKQLNQLIQNEGTVDGLTPPSAAGVLRLCLDLHDSRAAEASTIARIVAWLRETRCMTKEKHDMYRDLADAIERGEWK